MARKRIFPVLIFVAAIAAAGCEAPQNFAEGTAPAGPIDGTYTFTSWKCGSTDVLAFLTSSQGLSVGTITLDKNTTSIVFTISGGCQITGKFSVTYPAGGLFVNVDQGVTCGSFCSGAQCTSRSAKVPTKTDRWSYGASSSTLTVMRTLTTVDITQDPVLQGAGCTAGQVEAAVLTKK